MLSSFLFTPFQQRLLTLFLLHPEKRYSYAPLREAAGGGVSSLYRYLDVLVRAGVVTETHGTGEGVGSLTVVSRSSRWYQANVAHPLYPELRSIAVKTFGVLEPIQDALQPFAKSIQRALVFGSVVKHTDTHESDIDLLVVGSVRKGQLLMALKAAERSTGRPIHANVYGTAEWPTAQQDPVIQSILGGPTLELRLTEEGNEGGAPTHHGRRDLDPPA